MLDKKIKIFSSFLTVSILPTSVACSKYETIEEEKETELEKKNDLYIDSLKKELSINNFIFTYDNLNLDKIIDKENAFYKVITKDSNKKLPFIKIKDSYNFNWTYDKIKNIFSDKDKIFYNNKNNMVVEILPIKSTNKLLINLLFVRELDKSDVKHSPDYKPSTKLTEPWYDFSYDSNLHWYVFNDKLYSVINNSVDKIDITNNKILIDIKQKESKISNLTESIKLHKKIAESVIKLKPYKSQYFFSKNILETFKKPHTITKMQQRSFKKFEDLIQNNLNNTWIWVKDKKKFYDPTREAIKIISGSLTKTSLIKLLSKSYLVDLGDQKLTFDSKGDPNIKFILK
ncbi:hypothetical protein ACXYRK_01825 [Mycoplasma sp. AC1221]